MEYLYKSHSLLFTIGRHKYNIHVIFWILSMLSFGFATYLAIWNNLGLYFLGGIILIAVSILMILYPRFYVYSTIVFSIFFSIGSEEGINILDVITGLFYSAFTFIWFFWQIAIKKKKIVTNPADWLVLSFYILLLFNFLIAYFNDVPIFEWVKEYILYSSLLVYFPIKEYINTKKQFQFLLILVTLSIVVTVFLQFYFYYSRVLIDAVYAYQVGGGIKTNIMIFSAGTAFGIIFTLYIKKPILRYLTLVFTLLAFSGIVSTFSRAIWLITFFNIFLILLYVGKKQKIRLFTYLSIITVIFSFMVVLVFQSNAELIYNVIKKRFFSLGQGEKDISYKAREKEFATVYKGIFAYPIGGNGLAKEYHYIFPVNSITRRTNYVHNSYLHLTWRVGIPMTILFLLPILYILIKSEFYSRKYKDNFHKLIFLGIWISLLNLLLSSFLAPTLLHRDGILVLVYCYSFYSIALKIHTPNFTSKLLINSNEK